MVDGNSIVNNRALVLVSWVAVNNDPYERERVTGRYRLVQDQPVPGPTLTLLFDEESPYARRIHDVVLLSRTATTESKEHHALIETMDALRNHDPGISIAVEQWDGQDPTDHRNLFEFLRQRMPVVRQWFEGRE